MALSQSCPQIYENQLNINPLNANPLALKGLRKQLLKHLPEIKEA